jgi:hypothetical protein
MLPNIKYPIVLLLASFVLFLSTLLLLITHWPGAKLIVYVMIIIQAIAVNQLMSIFLKSRFPIVLFLAGFTLFLVGVLLGLLHWPGGLFFTSTMILVMIIAVAWLIIAILRTPKP